MAPIKDLKSNSKTEEIVNDTKMVQVPESVLAELMAKVQNIESKMWNTAEDVKKAKEQYQWPLKASLKMWWDDIVVSYRSKKKDPAYELMYKNWKNEWVDNHFIEMTFLNWKKSEVSNFHFWSQHTKTELMEFDAILQDWSVVKKINQKKLASLYNEIEYLVFNIEWEEVNVKPQFIN